MLVWIFGASGLVGGKLLQLLLADDAITRVVSVGRRELHVSHAKLTQVQYDFDVLTEFQKVISLPAPEAVFSCLGTTIKKAGSKSAFELVDFGWVREIAQRARHDGANTFIHITALGADPRSLFFYNQVKGKAELAIATCNFASSYAIRPSIIDGERAESRPGEQVGLVVARALGPLLGKYRPTSAAAIAATALRLAKNPTPGDHVVEPGQIKA
jgi:uncharacterized protein YbjT (DUF2867 family)